MSRFLDIAGLKARIRRIEQRRAALGEARDARTRPWRFGVAAVDALWPDDGLPPGALHVFSGAGIDDAPAAVAFMLALLARRKQDGSLLWCQSWLGAREFGRLYGPGLARFGIDPGRVVHVRLAKAADLAVALEEGARSPALAAVIAEGPALPFLATRRLTLATAKSATPVLFHDLDRSGRAGAAATSWRIRAAAGPPDGLDPKAPPAAPHAWGWTAELIRHRAGPPGQWSLVWNHETLSFDLAAPSGDRALPAQPARARPDSTGIVRLRRTG